MKKCLLLGVMLFVFLLASCTQKKAVELTLANHSSFPKDVEVKLEKESFSPETKSIWDMYVFGDRVLLPTGGFLNGNIPR